MILLTSFENIRINWSGLKVRCGRSTYEHAIDGIPKVSTLSRDTYRQQLDWMALWSLISCPERISLVTFIILYRVNGSLLWIFFILYYRYKQICIVSFNLDRTWSQQAGMNLKQGSEDRPFNDPLFVGRRSFRFLCRWIFNNLILILWNGFIIPLFVLTS